MPSLRLLLEEPIARVNPLIFGHFAEHLGTCIDEGIWVGEDSPIPNDGGLRLDVIAALRAMRPAVIRWPGGCFADTYDWRDGVGPRASRPRRVNVWWGRAIETNQFGTHEFIRLCRAVGAAPYICANLGSGSPREMAQWIEYCNEDRDTALADQRRADGTDAPFGVNYWGVGNENWGCGGAMEPDDYAREYRRFATYCHEFGGVPLYLIACGPNGNNLDWTLRFLDQWKHRARMHGFAAHYYCGTEGLSTEYDDDQFLKLVGRAVTSMERLVTQQRAALDAFDPERKIGLIVDEWGTWHKPDPHHPSYGLWQQNTIRDALVAAGTLDVFCRHADKVYMTNIAQMINVLQAMILTDGPRLLRTPTYHVYEMYAAHQDATGIRAVVETDAVTYAGGQVDAVDGSASLRNKQLTVTLSHRGLAAPAEVTLNLRGGAATAGTGRALAGADIRAHNTFDAPDAVTPAPLAVATAGASATVVLPPASVAVITLDLA